MPPKKKAEAQTSDEPVEAPVGDYPERPDEEALATEEEVAEAEDRPEPEETEEEPEEETEEVPPEQ
jgi:hypothetical protein